MTFRMRFRFTAFLSNRGANAKRRQSLDCRLAVTRCDLSNHPENLLRRLMSARSRAELLRMPATGFPLCYWNGKNKSGLPLEDQFQIVNSAR